MSSELPDVPDRVTPRARVAPAEPGEGWVKPSHGKGMLRPFQPGNDFGRNARPSYYNETVSLARQASPEAMRILIQRLHDPDGRIAVVAANSILERAYGKVRDMKPEAQEKAQIDLTALSASELKILLELAQSGRLRGVSNDGSGDPAPVIETEPVDAK